MKALKLESEEHLHKEIEEAVQEINELHSLQKDDSSLAPYLQKFNETFDFFDDCYNRNVKLLQYCQELNSIMIMNASKIQETINYTDESANTLKSLQSDYTKAAKEIQRASMAEYKAKQEIVKFRNDIDKLKPEVLPNNDLTTEINNLKQEIQDSKTEIDQIQIQIKDTKKEIQQINTYTNAFKSEENRITKELNDADLLIPDCSNTKTELKKQIIDAQSDIDDYTEKVKENTVLNQNQATKIGQLQKELTSINVEIDTYIYQIKETKLRISRYPPQMREQRMIKESKSELMVEVSKRLEEREQYAAELQDKLKHVKTELGRLQKEFMEIETVYNEFQGEKDFLKQKEKVFSKQVIERKFHLTKSDNDNSLEKRLISGNKMDLVAMKKNATDGSTRIGEIQNQIQNLTCETLQSKEKLFDTNETGTNLQTEIIQKQNELSKTNVNIITMKNTIEEVKDQINVSKNDLVIITKKNDQQSFLIEKLRDERDYFKRQFEANKAEHDELENQYDLLIQSIESMTYKIDKLSERTKNTKFTKEETENAIKALKDMQKQVTNGIRDTEKVVSQLSNELRSLTRILNDTETSRQQQQKEFHTLRNNFELVRDQLALKNKQLETMKHDIITQEKTMGNYSIRYREKMQSIATLQNEFNKHYMKNQELEKKRDYVVELDLKMKKTLSEAMIEKAKRMALYHQTDIPRQINHLSFVQAVNSELASSIQYCTLVTCKFNAAAIKLRELEEIRDNLKKQIGEMNEEIEKALTVDEVTHYMEKYSEDIRVKNKILKDMQSYLQNNNGEVESTRRGAISARVEVSQRKSIANSLKLKNIENRTPYFFTETPVAQVPQVPHIPNVSIACGFKPHPPSVPRLNLTMTDELMISPMPPLSQRYALKPPRISVPKQIPTNTPRIVRKKMFK